MKFKALQENLRKALWERIDNHQLTGLALAHQTGFQQAHISNFLNRKRGLSVEGMDKVLSVQHISVLDLLDPQEVNKRASIPAPSDDEFQNVLLVEGRVAASDPLIRSMKVKEMLKFKKRFLGLLRSAIEGDRKHWERFVAIRANAREAAGMYPRLRPRATVLIDRHYNALRPYRNGESNMYAVNRRGNCVITYVETSARYLILRPHNPAYPVEIIPLEDDKKARDYLVGRVCFIGVEA
jgi:hypothetical protein